MRFAPRGGEWEEEEEEEAASRCNKLIIPKMPRIINNFSPKEKQKRKKKSHNKTPEENRDNMRFPPNLSIHPNEKKKREKRLIIKGKKYRYHRTPVSLALLGLLKEGLLRKSHKRNHNKKFTFMDGVHMTSCGQSNL